MIPFEFDKIPLDSENPVNTILEYARKLNLVFFNEAYLHDTDLVNEVYSYFAWVDIYPVLDKLLQEDYVSNIELLKMYASRLISVIDQVFTNHEELTPEEIDSLEIPDEVKRKYVKLTALKITVLFHLSHFTTLYNIKKSDFNNLKIKHKEKVESFGYIVETHETQSKHSVTQSPFRNIETQELFEFIVENWSYNKDLRWSYIYNFLQEHGKLTSQTDYQRYIISKYQFTGKFQYEHALSPKNYCALLELQTNFLHK